MYIVNYNKGRIDVTMFWDNFLNLCAKVGKSPTAVVLELEISRGSITNWKRGVVPNDVTLKKIANYFNVTINYLLGNNEDVNISGNSLNGTYNVVGNQSQINVSNADNSLSTQEMELISVFRKLSEINKGKHLYQMSLDVEK